MISHAVLCLLATPGRAVRSQTFVSGSTGLRIWPARRTSSWPVSMAEEADTKGTRSCTRSINDSAPTKWRTRSPSPGNTWLNGSENLRVISILEHSHVDFPKDSRRRFYYTRNSRTKHVQVLDTPQTMFWLSYLSRVWWPKCPLHPRSSLSMFIFKSSVCFWNGFGVTFRKLINLSGGEELSHGWEWKKKKKWGGGF